jgi:Tfp pilus assembly protein PilO
MSGVSTRLVDLGTNNLGFAAVAIVICLLINAFEIICGWIQMVLPF